MAKIEVGRWSNQLRRMFGMAGVTDVSADLSPEISPVVVIEGPTADLLFLKEVRQIFAADFLAAAIGFTSKWRLRNPARSGVIAVIRHIEMVSPAAVTYGIAVNQQTVDFATVVNTAIPDARWEALNVAARRATLVSSAANNQATGPAGDFLLTARILPNTLLVFSRPFPLLPGTTLDFGTETGNVDLRMSIEWRERAFPVLEQ